MSSGIEMKPVCPAYTFENYAEDNNNALAVYTAKSVANSELAGTDILYLYGQYGVGKTHLLHAICNSYIEQNTDRKVLYLTSEDLIIGIIDSMRSGDKNDAVALKNRLRTSDLLLIDDIDIMEGKGACQQELYFTIQDRMNHSLPTVIAGDRCLRDMNGLSEGLITKIKGGVMVEVRSLGFEGRSSVLSRVFSDNKCNVDTAIIEYLVSRDYLGVGDIRSILYTMIAEKCISVDRTKELLWELYEIDD